MALLRAFAWVFLLAAVIVLTNDVTRSMAGNGSITKSALSYWQEILPGSLASTAGYVRNLHPKLWDMGLARILAFPGWVLLGAAGILFALLGRRKRRVNIFAN